MVYALLKVKITLLEYLPQSLSYSRRSRVAYMGPRRPGLHKRRLSRKESLSLSLSSSSLSSSVQTVSLSSSTPLKRLNKSSLSPPPILKQSFNRSKVRKKPTLFLPLLEQIRVLYSIYFDFSCFFFLLFFTFDFTNLPPFLFILT